MEVYTADKTENKKAKKKNFLHDQQRKTANIRNKNISDVDKERRKLLL